MLESHAQIVIFAGPDFVALYNDSYAPTIGHKHPEAFGQPASVSWAELWDDLGPMLRKVVATGQTISAKDRPFYIERGEFPETVYFDISYSPVREPDGKVCAVLCIVSETTERIRVQRDLRQSEGRLSALFAQATAGIAVGAPDGALMMMNDCFCEITGYSRAELAGRRIEDLLHPDDLGKSEEHLERLTRDGACFATEERLVRKDGTLVWIARSTGAVVDGAGKIVQISSIVTDITERRRAEAHHRQLAAIIAASDDAIIGTNLEMRITSWNGGAERLYGFSARDAIGEPVAMLIPEDRADEETEIMGRIRQGRRVERYETVRLHKDGHEIEVSLTISPIHDEHGRIVGASKIARDITARRAVERFQQLIVGEMKHRVKNILATVHAIARQTFRNTPSAESAAFSERLFAMSRAQDIITRGSSDGAELAELIAEVIRPYHTQRFDISGPSVILSARAALTFALGLHELATNAAKYGALAAPEGAVSITWTLAEQDENRFEMVWKESGGAPVTPSGQKGFGSTLIQEVMAAQIGGEVTMDFRPSGLVCTVTAPLDESWFLRDGAIVAAMDGAAEPGERRTGGLDGGAAGPAGNGADPERSTPR
jgi:PAS domain S-box-containing protein